MKHYVMEFVGTFFLTLAVVLMGANGLAVGAMLIALAYIGSHVSGAHYNPSFTLATVIGYGRSVASAVKYILAQLLGALAALVGIYLFVGVAYIHPIASELSVWMLLTIELLLTFVFTMVFLALTKTDRLRDNQIYGLAIGLTLTALVFFGGLYNAAIGTASFILDFAVKREFAANVHWYVLIYILAPLIAGAVAAFAHSYLNEKCNGSCPEVHTK